MAEGLKPNEGSGREMYPDIIDLPHWQSPTRPHMSLYKRAAQFMPFDALEGYKEMVAEDRRVTEKRKELDEDEKAIINRKLNHLAELLRHGENPVATFTVFIPDKTKAGGSYEEITDTVKRIDPTYRYVVLMTREGRGGLNRKIAFDDIYDVTGEALDNLDDSYFS